MLLAGKRPTEVAEEVGMPGQPSWALNRVGAVIDRLYGVQFGATQLWRILGALGFSVQNPEKRAFERNEDTVRQWKRRTWPALKK